MCFKLVILVNCFKVAQTYTNTQTQQTTTMDAATRHLYTDVFGRTVDMEQHGQRVANHGHKATNTSATSHHAGNSAGNNGTAGGTTVLETQEVQRLYRSLSEARATVAAQVRRHSQRSLPCISHQVLCFNRLLG